MISFTEKQRTELGILVEDLYKSKGVTKTQQILNIYQPTILDIIDGHDTPRYDHIVHRLRERFPIMNDWAILFNGSKTYKLSQLVWPEDTPVQRGHNLRPEGRPIPRVAAAKVISKPGKKTPISVQQKQDILKTVLGIWPQAQITQKHGQIIIKTGIYI